MGDAILATPSLQKLRMAMPDAHITFFASKTVKDILSPAPLNDDWIISDNKSHKQIRAGNFDTAILLRNSMRSALMVFIACIPRRIGYNRDSRKLLLTDSINPIRLGKKYAPISMNHYYRRIVNKAISILNPIYDTSPCPKMKLFTDKTSQQDVLALLDNWNITNNDRIITLVPGGAFGGSKWYPADRFAKLADIFNNEGYKVLISCAPNDAENEIAQFIIANTKSKVYNLLDSNISLGMLKEIIKRSSLLISNDTGPCHIAASFNTPLVTLFGPTDPRWTITGYSGETRLRINVDCGPCQKSVCPLDKKCLERIPVENVYNAAKQRLSATKTETDLEYNFKYNSQFSIYDESFDATNDGDGLIHTAYTDILKDNSLDSIQSIFDYCKKHTPNPGSQMDCFNIPVNTHDNQQTTLLVQIFFSRTNPAKAINIFHELISRPQTKTRPISFGIERGFLRAKRSYIITEAP